ncbi:hypothetical protein ABZS94_38670 [Streptomyces sp. NPDC005500]|uniref:hypothetical protein n=1 Tax=Streptomyces sp. NPDC005500 TaxID=3155007 RepID=UPI0033B6340A
MDFPIKVALAQAVPTLPDGPGWWFEPNFDGHRIVLRRTDDTVILYARPGNVVTPHWIDLALTGKTLHPGTALDGETVISRESRPDIAAAHSRASPSATPTRTPATRHPASHAYRNLAQQRSLPPVVRLLLNVRG